MTKIRFEWQAQRLVGSCSVWLLAYSFNVAQALVNSGICHVCHVDLHLVWRRHHLSLAGAESLGPLQVARQALHLLRQTWQGRHLVNFVGRRGCLWLRLSIPLTPSLCVAFLFLSDLHLLKSTCLCERISVSLSDVCIFCCLRGLPCTYVVAFVLSARLGPQYPTFGSFMRKLDGF